MILYNKKLMRFHHLLEKHKLFSMQRILKSSGEE